MSSEDTKRDLENVRQTVTDNITASQEAIEYQWDEGRTFFAAAVTGYNNLDGVDYVYELFARGNEVLTEFIEVQTMLSVTLMGMQRRL